MSAPLNPTMRVAINALTDFRLGYGSQVYLLALAEALSKLPLVKVILVVARRQRDQLPVALQSCAVEVDVPASPSYWQVLWQRPIGKLLRKYKADVWHLPNTLPLIFRFKSVPTVITIHDLADLRVRKYGRTRTLYRRSINYLGARKADRVLTVSENSRHDLVSMLGVAPAKVAVVYPGVNEKFWPHDPISSKEYIHSRYGLPREFILAPGGLGGNKNLNRVLEAFANLVSRGIKHNLICTGTTSAGDLARLQHLVRALRLTEKVFFPGCIPEDDLPKLYAASSGVVYVSLYEGFGLPLLEAMACGIPIVASNASSIPEVTQEAALLVDPHDTTAIADAMSRVLSEQDLRQTLIQRGLIRAQHFSWTNTAVQTIEVYKSAIQRFRSAKFGPLRPASRAA